MHNPGGAPISDYESYCQDSIPLAPKSKATMRDELSNMFSYPNGQGEFIYPNNLGELSNAYAQQSITPKPTTIGVPGLDYTLPAPKDSGAREAFPTGSVRDTRSGKGRFDLLPTRALRQLAQHFENGSGKYGSRNWEKGQPLSRYMDSALRHIFAHLEGKRDEPHAVAAVWNLMCLIDTEQRVREGILPKELLDLPCSNEAV